VNSGTSALHLACLALGLGKGDWLWTTPISFVASANCGLYCGAQVDFVDIDPESWNLSASALEQKLIAARAQNRLPKIVVAVHLCGLPCEMEKINQLSLEYGFSLIEDACHALGGRYQGEPIGSGRYSDITVFSFHPVKTITTGEGGMAVTNDEGLAEKMRLLRSHGITRDPAQMTHAPDGSWYYQQIELGFNYRISDLQAALGFSQLQRLGRFVEQRHEIADRYDQAFRDTPLQLPLRPAHTYSGLHLYVVRLAAGTASRSRDPLFEQLRAEGIGVNIHYIPIHTQPWYQQQGFRAGDFPQAEKYYSEAISLPIYPDLDEVAQQTVISVLKELL
ncbi:MAG: UDP-4-amino-4,6-dideoxy-N-acetyl-beta-L-altrosamine transaminase, partial [Gammaproteobacteria bacterium]|nr:UDP-4-amino-4,6-dideoxy-N-acetyl-beta-L-altrosamine transaminase [Gammaproteobacteria bacterium]